MHIARKQCVRTLVEKTNEGGMVRNGDINLADVRRILRRYWWILALTTAVSTLVAVLAVLLLPKRYTSQTMILVEQPTVPADYVKPIISGDLNHRLASMQEQILSRTRLQPIIDKFGLYLKDRQKNSADDMVARLRAAVKISPMEPMAGTDNRQLPGFYVNVDFDDPQIAQQICTEITSMFLEQNARERERQASRTTSFLSDQLNEAKLKLDEQDAKLAQFKRQYLGSLPEEEQTNLSLLTGMNAQLEANTQALSRAEQDRAFNESLLSQQELNLKSAQTGASPETMSLELSAMRQQLATLLAHYTPKHPDVVKLQDQIEELQKRQTEAAKIDKTGDAKLPAPIITPPQTQQLRAKIRQDEINIADLTRGQRQIQEDIRKLQSRVQASPVVEQQFKELTRTYQSASDFYNELLKKRQNSAMATDLEHQQESEQFRVFDPPSLPQNPSFPNVPVFLGGGCGAGLAAGLGILYLIAYMDKSLHTERDVEKCLKLPVLTLIPTVELAEADTDSRGSSA
jgi:polysaccharide chain length determinant protein (PEP-CTERM system associated)